MFSAIPIAAYTYAPSSKPAPTWAKDVYFGEEASLMLNQGGYADGKLTCCALDSPEECKVQAMNSGIDAYEQGSKNRTLTKGAQAEHPRRSCA